MKIGLISDTHIPAFSPEPPRQILKAFRDVDLILHAGDIYATSCLDWLEQIAPVLAVEFHTWNQNDPRRPETRVFDVEGYTIAMVHALDLVGMTSEPFQGTLPRDYPQQGSLEKAVKLRFGQAADIVVFGHTHYEMVDDYQGILLVNPGSPTVPRQLQKLGTVGLLELTPQGRSAHLIDLAKL